MSEEISESRQKIEQLKAALEATRKTLKGCEEERDTLQTKTQSLEGSTTLITHIRVLTYRQPVCQTF